MIPEEVRRALELKAGAKVEVLSKGRVAYIVPVLELETIQGILSESSAAAFERGELVSQSGNFAREPEHRF